MTLYHMLAAAGLILLSVGGFLAFHLLGLNPLVGFAAGIVAPIGIVVVMLALKAREYRLRPPLPPCLKGCCTQRDYQVAAATPTEIQWICRCGDRYVKMNENGGQRFMLVKADGTTVPYRKRRGRGPWIPADS